MSIPTTKRVWAKLWNDKRSYHVQLNLEVRELRGQNPLPDDYAIARIELAGGIAVEDGLYNLEFAFMGRQEKRTVRVVDGILMSNEAAA